MYQVSLNAKINYVPKNIIEEVITNVAIILKVCKEEQPLNRKFAFNSELIDQNIEIVENRITAELLELLREYEPRANLKQVRLELKDIQNNEFDITVGFEVME